MILPFEMVTSGLSVAAGLVSISYTILKLISSIILTHSKLHKAQEQRFQSILESDNLTVVGSYLDDVIGNFNLYEYVSNRNVSERIDRYLEKLRSFIGTDAEVKQQIKETKIPSKIKERLVISDPFDRILTELRSGEIWNALARLRRYIEISLREIARAEDIRIERPTAGQLLNVLSRRRLIPGEVLSNLKYAITVCNKAIHGVEVNWEEAEAAALHANFGLRRLKQKPELNHNSG